MYHDEVDQVLRFKWNVDIKLKHDVPGLSNPLIVDGISLYYLNWEGDIFKHEVTNLASNGKQIDLPIFDMNWLVNPVLGKLAPMPTPPAN